MKDFYTFIVTSTINTSVMSGVNVFDQNTRFLETIETLESIKRKVPNCKIILIDNSTDPLSDEQVEAIESYVDIFRQIDHNIFTKFVNNIGSKGMGEAYIMHEAIKIIEERDLVGKRIFKITGRYRLADSFDIDFYKNEDLIGKYAHKINLWDVSVDGFNQHRETVVYFETRLWSFCGSLFEEYKQTLDNIFAVLMKSFGQPMCNLERCHHALIPHNKVFELETAHVVGCTANDGVYKFE